MFLKCLSTRQSSSRSRFYEFLGELISVNLEDFIFIAIVESFDVALFRYEDLPECI
jgi:hypothetical protein